MSDLAQKKKDAYAAVAKALRTGELVCPDTCEECGGTAPGNPTPHAAHYNYDEPLRVRWLCASCHRVWDSIRKHFPMYEDQPLGVLYTISRTANILKRAVYEMESTAPHTQKWGSESVGGHLRMTREAMGLDQEEFAEALGISQPYLSQIESRRRTPSALRTRSIAAALSSEPLSRLLVQGGKADGNEGQGSAGPDGKADARKARQRRKPQEG